MTELLSLNEDETAHCYTCNQDSHLSTLSVTDWRERGAGVVARVVCPACGRDGELHLDRGSRAGASERRAYEMLTGGTGAPCAA
jgi:hypothetical protein